MDRSEAPLRGEELVARPVLHAAVEAFSGPIPEPEVLRDYEHVLPGLAERIVRWTEDEAHHRRTVERSLVQLSWGGLWSALLLALTTILGGMLLAWYGRSVVGVIGVVGALAGLVIVFMVGQGRPVPDTTESAGKKPAPG
ncbi:MAG TPA: DUF2335 domain-containing protein [Longimicrobium sp.]|nr:DUF2335 domain-containing protein [Longimicrobium sp.]